MVGVESRLLCQRHKCGRRARGKSVVPASALRKGTSVLNADNPCTVKMADVARGEIIHFSRDEANPVVREHVKRDGRAVVLRETFQGWMLTLVEAKRTTTILSAREIPASFGERVRGNVANALAATAAAIGAGVSLTCIREALRTFGTSY